MRPLACTPEATRRAIADLRSIDLRTAGVDDLKVRLNALMAGHIGSTPRVEPGPLIYRGVPYGERDKPMAKAGLSYPPVHRVKTFGRVTRPGQSVFYGTSVPNAPAFELGLVANQHVAIGRWRIKAALLLNNVGYAQTAFADLASQRAVPEWATSQRADLSEVDRLIAGYFAEEFAKVVQPGHEHLYMLSVAIAEMLFRPPITMVRRVAGYDGPARWGGLLYPCIPMKADGDNVALLPEAADTCLVLEYAEWARVESVGADGTYHMTLLDFANTFGPNGEIEWKGRLPQVTIPPGAKLKAGYEDGRFVVRDKHGRIVDGT